MILKYLKYLNSLRLKINKKREKRTNCSVGIFIYILWYYVIS